MERNIRGENAQAATASSIPQRELSIGLGIFSLALGLTEVLLTKRLGKLTGIDSKYGSVVQGFGMREISSGVGLLASKNKNPWLWSRVMGDALDVGFLAWVFYNEKDNDKRWRIAAFAASISPVIALDVLGVVRASDRGATRCPAGEMRDAA